ncbi:hypothetical protein MCOR25_007443 [Pyricularia grisea]|uniref:Cyanovirin-N domain-containing protein n=1 Tax=Pyricularia grisea TaxID=148305 RepID=A0A6P8BKE6_PYRGI|nr:uncharacterized protein PgNI_01404 [Pyricularia grisea]KAI6358023.1 hypothetical protein MCOR25_007443 [Pyricularia grisea]TLD17047.1 hypothetical protein PgNI_01404 [Pyricularia grisea]
MSFHHSAENIRVEGTTLCAMLRNGDGEMCDASCDLNDYIGNNEGRFEWGGSNFSGSAEDIRFEMEGDGQPILRARLRDSNGDLHDADINLTERFGNNNGNFHWQ